MNDFVGLCGGQASVSADNAPESMVTGLFCDGNKASADTDMTINIVTKTVDSPTSLAQSLRHRARFVDVLEHKSGTNTTIAKG